MKIILNIVRKDLTNNLWPLGLWLALLLTHLGIRHLQLSRPFTADPDSWLRFFNTSGRPDLALVLVLPVLLIPLLMLSDPVGRRLAFWRALPVSRTRLLAAKAVLVGAMFVALPLAVEIGYFLHAGMTPVLGSALGLWLKLHLPVVGVVFLLCCLTPGWKSYLCLAVVMLGLGFPVPRVPRWVERHLERAGLAVSQDQPPAPPAGELPAGVSFEVAADTAGIWAVVSPAPAQDSARISQVGAAFEIRMDGLPVDVVLDQAACEHVELLMANGEKARFDASHVDLGSGETDSRGIANRRMSASANSPGLHPGGSSYPSALLEPLPERRTEVLRASCDLVPFDYQKLPADGGILRGTVRATFARKHVAQEMPLQDGTVWRDKVRTLAIALNGADEGFPPAILPELRLSSTELRPLTALGPNATELDYPPRHSLWLEHRDYPLRLVVRPVAAGWSRSDSSKQSWADLSRNLASEARQLSYQTDWLDDRNWSLFFGAGFLRMADAGNQVRSWDRWRLALVRHEPLVEVTLPFTVKVAKPYHLINPGYGPQHPRSQPLADPDFSSALAAIQLPEKPTKATTAEAFFQLSALCGPGPELGVNLTPDNAVIERHDLEIDRLLRRIYQLDPELLVAGARRAAVQLLRETSDQDRVNYGRDETDKMWSELFNGNLWGRPVRRLSGYWQKVNRVVETASTPADKALILANLHPALEQLPTLERHGWLQDALPAMTSIARNEWVSEAWFRALRSHPAPETKEALLAQVRLRAQPFGRMVELFTPELPEAEQQQLAATIWQTAVKHAPNAGSLRGALLIALKSGLPGVPQVVKRALEARNERDRIDPEDRQQGPKAYLSIIQAMALWSHCPEDFEQGRAWILEHGDDLKWDAAQRRYLLPGDATAGIRAKPVRLDDWGTLINPLGLGRVSLSDTDPTIRSSAMPADYNWNHQSNFAPRVMREVTGDFTAEVTVRMAGAVSPKWDGPDLYQFQAGGLLVEAGRQDWIRFGQNFHGDKAMNAISETLEKGGNPKVAVTQFEPGEPISLRLQRHGDIFTSAWKQGDAPWRDLTGHRLHQWPQTVKLGVFTVNINTRPLEVEFSRFSIIHAAPPPPGPLDAPEHPVPPEAWPQDGDEVGGFGTTGNPSGAGAFNLSDQMLSIVTQPKTSAFNPAYWDNAPRATQEVTGDFSYAVTIGPPGRGKGFACPNLMFADAGRRFYFRTGPARSWDEASFNRFLTIDGSQVYLPPMQTPLDFDSPMRVRLTRIAGLFAVAVKQGDEEWVEFPPFLVPGCPSVLRVGVVSENVSDRVVTGGFENPELRLPQPSSAEGMESR